MLVLVVGFAVICRLFAFFDKGLGVWDEVEVAQAFLALASELNGHDQDNPIVAHCILSIDKQVIMRKIHYTV